ncbi:hypothetical protein LXL04_033585 [Taraxacum kok-saghyz]
MVAELEFRKAQKLAFYWLHSRNSSYQREREREREKKKKNKKKKKKVHPQIVEDEYGPVLDQDEDVNLCEKSMEVNENRRANADMISNDNPLKDTGNDQQFVISGQDFLIPTVPEEIKPKEEACYPSREAIEEI